MSTDCQSKNPVIRDGTSQAARYPQMLDPALSPIDDRSLLDLLSFVRGFSKEINYYDISGDIKGNWEEFFSDDEIFLPVSINDFNIQSVQSSLLKLNALIDATNSVSLLKIYFRAYFDVLFSLAYQLDNWNQRSTQGLLLNKTLSRLIAAELRLDFKLLLETYLNTLKSPILIETEEEKKARNKSEAESGTPSPVVMAYQRIPLEKIINKEFSNEWIVGSFDSWQDYYDSISADAKLFGEARSSVKKAVKQGAAALFKIGERYISVFQRLSHQADSFLSSAIDDHAEHQPHNTLIITFLKLFAYNQEHLNGITARHLDFFYKDVLKFELKEEVPAKAHVFFELINSKHITSHLLEQDTELKAGKDGEGNPVVFKTSEDLVINKAKVASLKSVFIDREKGYFPYSSEVANSKDGLGEDFDEEGTAWKAFGQTQYDLAESEKHMTSAEIGWVFASTALYLAEGVRSIDLQIDVTGLTQNIDPNDVFDIYLTGESGWILVKTDVKEAEEAKDLSTISLSITLPEDTESIIPFDSEIHEGGFLIDHPAIKFIAKQKANGDHAYEDLKDLIVNSINIDVEATVTQLSVQNDASSLDPGGPFLAFGSQPTKGSSFIIGSQEVFSKNISELTVQGDWLDYPEGSTDTADGISNTYSKYSSSPTITVDSFLVDFKKLENGKWSDLHNGSSQPLFSSKKFNASLNLTTEHAYESEFSDERYQRGVKSGFIKAEISAPSIGFGHKVFPHLYSKVTVNEMNNSIQSPGSFNVDNLPLPPYTPNLANFSLSYKAFDTLNLESETDQKAQFIHIHPFGFEEELPQDDLRLFPSFGRFNESNSWTEHEGECYIGITDLNLPESLTLYIEVSEGSENPDRHTEEVSWFYLSNNEWIAFEDTEILADSTNGFIQSGIVKFELPKTLTSNNTLMPVSQYWLKAAIAQNSDAVCDVIAINTQAVLAEYDNRNNDVNFLSNTIPAEMISKLNKRQSAVKSVTQSFGSFDGQMAENSVHFYTRVSERLRHKDRGIAIWDYERLVLEAFPEIYKVKTVNHSVYNKLLDSGVSFDSEFAPGYVTIIVVPDVSQKNLTDPYRPRASKAKLESIKSFVEARMPASVQAEVQVQNPQFEQIQVDFEVEFLTADRGYYERQLNEDIKKFLTPWAFDQGQEINFGGKIHKSTILNYIEELDYVDYVAQFKMNQLKDNVLLSEDIEAAYPSTAKTIFVSITADSSGIEHIIKPISK